MELVLPSRAVRPPVTPQLGVDAGSEGGTDQGAGEGQVPGQAQAGAQEAGLGGERGDLQPGEGELTGPAA